MIRHNQNGVIRPCAGMLRAGIAGIPLFLSVTAATHATEPCDDFGECKVLIEINATDGDIGFHWLVDGDGQRSTRIRDPNGRRIWTDFTSGALREQRKTENFGESSEPLCWPDPEAEPDEEIVTLREFRERWDPGTYTVFGRAHFFETLSGETDLTYWLPAAPQDVNFHNVNSVGDVISWMPGNDLGNCAPLDGDSLQDLVDDGVLGEFPEDVPVRAWEIVLEPDVDDGDPTGTFKFTTRVPGDIEPKRVTVPADYLASLPEDTPVKIEVGAIGGHFTIIDGEVVGDDDNATFTEADGFCVNEVEGCEED